jgi:hypothetical protein
MEGAAHTEDSVTDGGQGAQLRQVLVDLLQELRQLADSATDAISASGWAPSEEPRSHRVGVIERLLTERLDDSEAARLVAELGWSRRDRCVLVAAVDPDDPYGRRLTEAAEELASVVPQGVVGPVLAGPTAWAVVLGDVAACDSHDGLLGALEVFARSRSVVLTVTQPMAVHGMGDIFAWLRHEIALVRQLGMAVVPMDLLVPHVAIAGNSPAFTRWQVERTLGPLLAQPSRTTQPLLATLEVLSEPGIDLRTAASRLHVSSTGLRDRIARIQELTGLDLRKPGDAWLLLTATWMLLQHPDVRDPG